MAPRYSDEPDDRRKFTEDFDRFYTAFAGAYDLFVKFLPLWSRWLRQALPHIRGPRVLEVSFGTGWLLTRYAGRFKTSGLDYNRKMAAVARRNLNAKNLSADLVVGNVEALPWPDASFDTIVNTMAFSGYPDGDRAMGELRRVLKPGGRLLLIDFTYPEDGNRLGAAIARFWARSGDIIRDMNALFRRFDFDVTDRPIGGFGSVHLYIARKPTR